MVRSVNVEMLETGAPVSVSMYKGQTYHLGKACDLESLEFVTGLLEGRTVTVACADGESATREVSGVLAGLVSGPGWDGEPAAPSLHLADGDALIVLSTDSVLSITCLN